MTRSVCYTLQIDLQAMSNGGLRCSLNKGSCRRSSDAMTTWRSQCDAHCALKQGQKMMSRPGPKSGTRSSHCSRPLDQNNTCSSWCEGCGPIRRVHGKRPRRYAVNTSKAEALRRTATKLRGPIQLKCWTVHSVRLPEATRFLVRRTPAT